VSVVIFKFLCNILISGKIIKEIPGSVASETSYIWLTCPRVYSKVLRPLFEIYFPGWRICGLSVLRNSCRTAQSLVLHCAASTTNYITPETTVVLVTSSLLYCYSLSGGRLEDLLERLVERLHFISGKIAELRY